MKPDLIFPAAIAAALAFLTACGGETKDAETDKPEFAETKTVPKADDEIAKEEDAEEADKKAEQERRRAAAEERGRKWFEEKDIDGDGALTQVETGNLAWAFLHMADENGDGQVTGEEAKASAEQAREDAKAGRFRRPEPTKVIEIIDTDGDGMIGAQELPERARGGIGMVDVDGDGKVSLVEIEILNAQQEARVKERQQNNSGDTNP